MTINYKDLIQKNFKPSKPDARDHIAKVSAPARLPVSIDLKPWADEVEDQLNIGSCTANAGCSALELAYLRAGHSKDFSRLYLYWFTRLLGGLTGDSGAYPRDIGRALNKYGVCLEASWDYDVTKYDVEPPAPAQAEAVEYLTKEYARIIGTPTDVISQIKDSLAQGIPVLTSMAVHDSFFYLRGDWKTHTWDSVTTTTNPIAGYHEVLIIGYDDVSQRFLAENSWGSSFGDGGFFGIPYSFIGGVIDEWWVLSVIAIDYVPFTDVDPQPTPVPPAPVPPTPTPTPEDKENAWVPYVVGGAVVLFVILKATGII